MTAFYVDPNEFEVWGWEVISPVGYSYDELRQLVIKEQPEVHRLGVLMGMNDEKPGYLLMFGNGRARWVQQQWQGQWSGSDIAVIEPGFDYGPPSYSVNSSANVVLPRSVSYYELRRVADPHDAVSRARAWLEGDRA